MAQDEPAQPDQAKPDEAKPEIPGAAPGKVLTPAARRALEEAQARRDTAQALDLPPEKGGRREGPEAVRYGDWERRGIAVDF